MIGACAGKEKKGSFIRSLGAIILVEVSFHILAQIILCNDSLFSVLVILYEHFDCLLVILTGMQISFLSYYCRASCF